MIYIDASFDVDNKRQTKAFVFPLNNFVSIETSSRSVVSSISTLLSFMDTTSSWERETL